MCCHRGTTVHPEGTNRAAGLHLVITIMLLSRTIVRVLQVLGKLIFRFFLELLSIPMSSKHLTLSIESAIELLRVFKHGFTLNLFWL